MRRKGPGKTEDRIINQIDSGRRRRTPRAYKYKGPHVRAVRRDKDGSLVPHESAGKER